jgi:hypothetical protein
MKLHAMSPAGKRQSTRGEKTRFALTRACRDVFHVGAMLARSDFSGWHRDCSSHFHHIT